LKEWKPVRLVLAVTLLLIVSALLYACSTEQAANSTMEEEEPVEHAAKTAVTITPFPAVEEPVLYDEIMKKEAEWLQWLRLDSGVVPKFKGPNGESEYNLTPYFTVIALEGLLEVPGYESVVLDYMNWHFAHLNRTATETTPIGSIDDYVILADGTEKPKGDFDSTDSYASTFINLLRRYAEFTGDSQYLIDHKEEIDWIADAMLSTLEPDGLTWAKPSYKVKYVMDNAEVYSGLRDLEWMSREIFGDEAAAAEYKRLKEVVSTAIEQELWDESRQAYAFAKGEDGSLSFPNWTVFYPDATAQLFPIVTGLIEPDSERAIALYNKFNTFHRGWPLLQKPDAFPWAILAYTAALMGDKERTDQFLASVNEQFIAKDHPWPWYVMESGLTIWAASIAKQIQSGEDESNG